MVQDTWKLTIEYHTANQNALICGALLLMLDNNQPVYGRKQMIKINRPNIGNLGWVFNWFCSVARLAFKICFHENLMSKELHPKKCQYY
jgi:hypothetical protein